MLPCLFSCFASCMMSGELFYGWCVLGAAVAGHGSAGASPAGQEAAGEGRGGTLGLFQPQRFHDFMALRCPSRDRALLPAGRPPSPQRDSGHVLGSFWAGSVPVLGTFRAASGPVLGTFWAGSGHVLGRSWAEFALPPSSPFPARRSLPQRSSGGSGTAHTRCYLVNPPLQLRIIQRTVTLM